MPTKEEIINIGFSLHQEGKLDEAENAYNEALKIDSTNAEVYNLIGVLKLQKGETDEALKFVEQAIEKSPQAYFYETLLQALIRKENYAEIVKYEDYIMKHFSDNFSLLFNLAMAHKNLKDNKKAISLYEKALNINPSSYQGWFNLAHLYSVEAQTKNAVSALSICKKLRPNDDDTEYFLALALMRIKDYEKGLKHFERRLCRETAVALQNKTYPNKARKDNLWKGENIKDKTLFVYYEAGFGDAIMFARYLPLAKQKCKKLILMIQKPLGELFRQNPHLGVDVVIDQFTPESNIDFDVHLPMLSLPYILKLKGNDVFAFSEGYIKANEQKTEEFREKYFNNDSIKIGIKWQGNTYYDKDRVIPVKSFIPLTGIANTKLYSFQTFEGSEEIKKLSDAGVVDIGKELSDFSDTASAISNMDLIICNDTSLAHLAGAMNVPCWILLPYEVNWRWHTDLSVCDWYESVKLYRQPFPGDWESVFKIVKLDIEEALSEN